MEKIKRTLDDVLLALLVLGAIVSLLSAFFTVQIGRKKALAEIEAEEDIPF